MALVILPFIHESATFSIPLLHFRILSSARCWLSDMLSSSSPGAWACVHSSTPIILSGELLCIPKSPAQKLLPLNSLPRHSWTLGISSSTENPPSCTPLPGINRHWGWGCAFLHTPSFRFVSSQPGPGPAQRREQKHFRIFLEQ